MTKSNQRETRPKKLDPESDLPALSFSMDLAVPTIPQSNYLADIECHLALRPIKQLSPVTEGGVSETRGNYSEYIQGSTGLLDVARSFSPLLTNLLLGAGTLSFSYPKRDVEILQEAISKIFKHKQEDWDSVVSLLERTQKLDANQLAQAQLHAERRRYLRNCYTFLSPAKLKEIAPGLLGEARNVSRTASNLLDQGAIIGMRDGGRLAIPACQIDSSTLDVFEPLKPVIKKAYEAGQTAWEILDWLVSEAMVSDARPGRPIDIGADADIAEFLSAQGKTANATSTPTYASPLSLLKKGDHAGFLYLAERMANETY